MALEFVGVSFQGPASLSQLLLWSQDPASSFNPETLVVHCKNQQYLSILHISELYQARHALASADSASGHLVGSTCVSSPFGDPAAAPAAAEQHAKSGVFCAADGGPSLLLTAAAEVIEPTPFCAALGQPTGFTPEWTSSAALLDPSNTSCLVASVGPTARKLPEMQLVAGKAVPDPGVQAYILWGMLCWQHRILTGRYLVSLYPAAKFSFGHPV